MGELDGHRNRLKEKYLNHGIESFYHDYEKLEFLLTFIIPRRDVKSIAKSLLEKFGNIENIIKSTPKELTKVIGVGEGTALYLNFLSDLNKTLFKEHFKSEKTEINTKKSLLEYIRTSLTPYLKNEIGFDSRENFFILYLDSANRLINDKELKSEVLFRGTIDRSAVYPREIVGRIVASEDLTKEVDPLKNKLKVSNKIEELTLLKELSDNPQKIYTDIIKYRAKSVIFAHNHPSGNYKPSRNDIELTQSLKITLSMIDVRLLDHIIVTKESYYSFLEEGLLE